MNHLKLFAGFLGAAALAYSGGFTILERQKRTLETETHHFQETKSALRSGTDNLNLLKDEIKRARTARASAHSELTSAQRVKEDEEIDPEKEGLWPIDKPYFYFHKQLISHTWFLTTTDLETKSNFHQLTPELVRILALSPNEALVLEEDLRSVVLSLREVQKQTVHPLPSPVEPTIKPAQEFLVSQVSYRIPAMKDRRDEILAPMFENAETLLGSERAEVYRDRINRFFQEDHMMGGGKKEVTITLSQEKWPKTEITRIETWLDGRFHTYGEIYEDGIQRPAPEFPPNWVHLFGPDGKQRPK